MQNRAKNRPLKGWFCRWKSLQSLESAGTARFVVVFLGFLLLAGGKVHAGSFTNTIAISRAAITNLMAEHSIPGCTVVLVESQEVVWAEGFGYADKETLTPVTTNTVMMIGSVSKMLTALMALQVMDEGGFDLDACITNYVTEFSMLDRFSGTPTNWTIRTMLDHHSGIPGDIYNGSFVSGPYWSGYTDWLIEYFHDDYPLYPPMLQASYCNSGFNVVGEAIGRHDGVDFTVAASNRLFTPLGMTTSSFLPITNNLATGYSNDGSPAPLAVANMPATGGAFSTPLDMANIIKMLLADGMYNSSRFLSTNALLQFGKETPGPMDVDNFFKTGLGLDTVSDPVMSYAGRTWLKNGSTGKFEALFEVLPDQQLGAFVNINFANSDTFAILQIILTNAVEERNGLTRPPTPPMPTPAETNWSFAELQAIEGYYITKSGVDHFMAQADGSLSLIHNAEQSSVVTTNYRPHTNGRFFIPGHGEEQLVFTNRAGYDVIIRYGSNGSTRDNVIYGGYVESLYGTRYTPPTISAAWSNRCGTFWVANNIMYDDYFLAEGSPSGWYFTIGNEILTVEGNAHLILSPVSDTLAFVGGLSSRADSCVRVETNASGEEIVVFGGYRCMRIEELPALTNQGVAHASLSMHTNALFTYAGNAGDQMQLVLSTNASQAVIHVINPDTFLSIACGTGAVQWTCSASAALINISSPNTLDIQVKAVDVSYLRQVMQQTLDLYPEIPGFSVGVQEPGFVSLKVAEGYAAIDPPTASGDVALGVDDHFHIASISKTYTAAAIMKLQDQGLLNITNGVNTYAPELLIPRGEELTLKLLLEHRSGLPDGNNTPWIDDQLIPNPTREFTVEEIVAVASNMYPNLMFDPGTDFHYTDTGFNILARVVENVSGTNYQAFVRNELLTPLGLTNTFVPDNDDTNLPPPAVHAYEVLEGEYQDRTYYSPSAEFGCGSLQSNLDDLMHFMRSLFCSTNVLSDASRALMMSKEYDYALGCEEITDFGWGHNGTMWGALSWGYINTNSEVAVSSMINFMYDGDKNIEKLFNELSAMKSAMGVALNTLGQPTATYGEKAPQAAWWYPLSLREGHEVSIMPTRINFVTNWSITGLPASMGYDVVSGLVTGRCGAVGDYPLTFVVENRFGIFTNDAATLSIELGYTNTIAKTLEQIETAYAGEEFEGGSWVLVDGEDIVWSGGYGYADHAKTVSASADTVYRIGSISKLFTTVSALRECDRGHLVLDAAVTNYDSNMSNMEPRPDSNLPPIDYTNNPITVRSLLNHLSGLPSTYMRNAMTARPYQDFLFPSYLGEALIGIYADFGTMPVNFFASYNNNGFLLAEYLISEVSGISLSNYAQTNLFMALDMTHTGFDMDAASLSNHLAQSFDENLNPMPKEYNNCLGPGGALSSANDMGQFIKMLLAQGSGTYAPVLQSNTVLDMMSVQTTGIVLNVGSKLFATGLGWDSALLPNFEYAGGGCCKNGETTTFAAYIALATNHNLGVFVVKNSPQANLPTELAEFMLEKAIEEKSSVTPPENPILPSSPFVGNTQTNVDALAGYYVNSAGFSHLTSGSNCLYYGGQPQYLRADGWYSAETNSSFLIGFTNVSGHIFSKVRLEYGRYIESAVTAERYVPPVITNAWTNRINQTWLIQSLPDISYMRTHAGGMSAETWQTNGLFMLTMPSIYLDNYSGGFYGTTDCVLEPFDDDIAFVQGAGGKMPCSVRGDDETLVFDSYYWQNITSITHIAHARSTNYAPYPLVTDWFSFDAEAGTEYFLNLGGSVTGLFMLVDADGHYLGDGSQENMLRWTCPSSGVYYAGINFPMDAPAEVTVQFYNYTNTIALMTQWITNQMALEKTVGVSIALLDDSTIVWSEGFGYANREAGDPVTTATVFHVGSVSKAFTSATALQYLDAGTLNLDDPLTNYLPTISWKERYPAAESVTIRDVLDMYSGLPGDLLRGGFSTIPEDIGYANMTNDLFNTYPIHIPNYVWSYCNLGYVLMEGVIEALANTGSVTRSFTTIANDNLLAPLGMTASSYLKDKTAISNHLATAYLNDTVAPEEFVNIYGTGSMYSRPNDLCKFIAMILDNGGALLQSNTVREMTTPQGTNAVFADFEFRSGLGWDMLEHPYLDYAGRMCNKSGGTLAYSAMIEILQDHNLGVALCSSSPSGIPSDGATIALRYALLDKVGEHWPTNEITFPSATQTVEQTYLDGLAGLYVGGASAFDKVTARSGCLDYQSMADAGGSTFSNLTLRTNGWFVSDAYPSVGFAFTNHAGLNILLLRQILEQSVIKDSLHTVKYAPPALPAAWLSRTAQVWYAQNEDVYSYMPFAGVTPELGLNVEQGVLIASSGLAGLNVLNPTNDHLAFVVGLGNRGDSCMQVIDDGTNELLLIAGYLFGPPPETMTDATSVTGNLTRAGQAGWHEVSLPTANPIGRITNVVYEATLSEAPSNFLLRIYDNDGITLLNEQTGNPTLAFDATDGKRYLYVQPTPDGVQTGSYELAFNMPVLIRNLQIKASGVDLVWQGHTNTTVTLETADQLNDTSPFAPSVTNISPHDVLNSYTNPLPPEPYQFYRIIENAD